MNIHLFVGCVMSAKISRKIIRRDVSWTEQGVKQVAVDNRPKGCGVEQLDYVKHFWR